jgi:hypothetical protein
MKSRTLKLQTIIDKRACPEQVKLFRKVFGKSVRVTEPLCVRMANQFDFTWAAQNLLTPEGVTEYTRVIAPALAEYARVRAPAWAEYERVSALAFARWYLL